MSQENNYPSGGAYIVWSQQLSNLQGQLLTIVDAAFSDTIQRKATKDLVTSTLWGWVIEQPRAKSEGLDSPNFTIIDTSNQGQSQGSF